MDATEQHRRTIEILRHFLSKDDVKNMENKFSIKFDDLDWLSIMSTLLMCLGLLCAILPVTFVWVFLFAVFILLFPYVFVSLIGNNER